MKSVFLVCCGLVFIIACKHAPLYNLTRSTNAAADTTLSPQDTSISIQDTAVCFERDILPIFIGSCAKAGCHDSKTDADGYNLSSYKTIILKGLVKFKPNSSKLYTECTGGRMPESPTPRLTSAQLSLINRWILKGAPDDTDCALNCDTAHYNFAANVIPIINKYCNGCHATSIAATSGGGIILDTYSSVLLQAQNGKLIGDLNHNTGFNAMPVGGNKLPFCEITQIQKWIDAGAKNN